LSEAIHHDAERRRYSLLIDGTEAYLTYERPRAGHRHVTHTIVPDALSGRGLGRRLVSRLMEDVIAAEETVSSSCWFASALIERTPDWRVRLAA
jgi:predicted GNAT family acetyltransferase